LRIKFAFTLVLVILLAAGAFGDSTDTSEELTIRDKHQSGVRIGAWVNKGETTPKTIIDPSDPNIGMNTSINSGNFYLEGFFAYSFTSMALGEISFGLSNRGSVTFYDNINSDIGNLIVYPILAQLKVYPLSKINSKFQPFFTGGGGVYFGRRDVQIIRGTVLNPYYEFQGETQTEFNFAFGGGFDWLLSDRFGIEFSSKYMPISFGEPLVGVKKYDGLSIMVGIKYFKSKNTN